MKKLKISAAKLLVARGAFPCESAAESWILSGKVLIGNRLITSRGQVVGSDEPVRIRGYNKQYVGRGGVKLSHALTAFSVDASGRVAIDTGASVGGFTDCLIKNGAARVYAVEAGVGQLHGSLRTNPRVVNLENTNIGDAALMKIMQQKPTLASVDIGYLSLRKALPLIFPLMDSGSEAVCLVKPLFEIDNAVVRRTGEIGDDDYLPILNSLIGWLRENGFYVANITYSPILGGKGTREFFLHVRNEQGESVDMIEAVTDAVRRVLEIPNQPEDDDGYF